MDLASRLRLQVAGKSGLGFLSFVGVLALSWTFLSLWLKQNAFTTPPSSDPQ
jgi:hypothetical protein